MSDLERDPHLQSLKIASKLGDPSAAIEYFLTMRSRGQALRSAIPLNLEPIEIQPPRMRGVLLLEPLNFTSILVSTSVDPKSPTQEYYPLTIYGIAYRLRARYYFYPELGWVPYKPDVVAHAQDHLQRFEESGKPDSRGLSFWLPRPEHHDDECPYCGIVWSSPERTSLRPINSTITLNIYRTSNRGTTKAIRNIDTYLRSLIPEWVANHQDLMLRAQLNH